MRMFPAEDEVRKWVLSAPFRKSRVMFWNSCGRWRRRSEMCRQSLWHAAQTSCRGASAVNQEGGCV